MWRLPAGYDFLRYENWFREYSQEFLVGSEFDVANVQLKIDHTMRVLEFARQIAEGSGSGRGAEGAGRAGGFVP